MDEIENAALADHRVVIQILLQPLPELERMLVKRLIAVQEIVGTDDRGVAPDIAAANPPFLQDRHPLGPVVARQVIGGRQTMPAAADDDVIIMRLRRHVPPSGRPAFVASESFFNHS